jgi:hypothetical protein
MIWSVVMAHPFSWAQPTGAYVRCGVCGLKAAAHSHTHTHRAVAQSRPLAAHSHTESCCLLSVGFRLCGLTVFRGLALIGRVVAYRSAWSRCCMHFPGTN